MTKIDDIDITDVVAEGTQIGSVTLDVLCRRQGTDDEAQVVGEIEIPVTIDNAEVTASVEEAFADHRRLLAAELEPGRVYFVCGSCREFQEAGSIRVRAFEQSTGAVCEACA